MMKRVILYVLFVVFAVSATAKPFKVVDLGTATHNTTDTVTGTKAFELNYKGQEDTASVLIDPINGSGSLDTAYVTYLTRNGIEVATDVVTSFTTAGTGVYFNIPMNKHFPASVKTRVLLKYTHNGKSTSKLYYIIY
jgi:hypothetical protein